MPKLPGRRDARPQIELSSEWLIDRWIMVLREWERPGPCAVKGCEVRPRVGDRAAVVIRDNLDPNTAATICEQHVETLERIHDEQPRDDVDAWGVSQ